MTPARIARLLAQGAPDTAWIATDVASVRWLSGLAGQPHEIYGMAQLCVVVGPGGDLRVVAPAGELAWIEERRALDDVVAHGSFVLAGRPSAALARGAATGRSLADALAVALHDVGAGQAVVLDDGMPASRAREVTDALAPRRAAVDAAPFLRARAVKDAEELAVLRRVNDIAERAIAAALQRAAPGATEQALLRDVRRAMLDDGARPMLGSVGIGERGALVDFAAGERALARGDVIRLDVGATLDGYHADLARTAVLGPVPEWVAPTYDALLAGESAAMAACRPGATGEQLFAAAVDAVRTAGLDDYARTHCGHGIGLSMYEPPSVAPGAHDGLEPGMTLCLETPLYLIGTAGVQIEDAVVVTADGCERLGALERDLIVLD
jgi:Xaa-Pro aminopeptidase